MTFIQSESPIKQWKKTHPYSFSKIQFFQNDSSGASLGQFGQNTPIFHSEFDKPHEKNMVFPILRPKMVPKQ